MMESEIKNEDCLVTMSNMADNSVDCVITSPPYNMNLRIRNGKYCSRQIVKEISTKYDGYSDNLPIEDFYRWQKSVISELLRISPLVFYNIAIVTGSKRAFFRLIGDFADELKDIFIWDKKHGQPSMQERVVNRQSELILAFGRDGISREFKTARFQRGTMSDILQIGRGRKKMKNHGACFPDSLVSVLLENFTKKGDIIYDPFMGSGTTGFVCAQMGRVFIGSEINHKYCQYAQDRINGLLL